MKPSTAPRLTLVLIPFLGLLGSALLQLADSHAADKAPESKRSPRIIPIVSLRPGETQELLLSTHCTVGVTRGGGFVIAEMRDGQRIEGKIPGSTGATYTRDGVTISLPGWKDATEFAGSGPYKTLAKQGIQVFTVTVSTSDDAQPGLLEMHLLDATCSGHCTTDFRVLVRAP